MIRSSESTGACGERCLLAHHLNNGLGVIIGYCELLALSEARPDVHQRLTDIIQTAKRLSEHVNAHQCRIIELIRIHDPKLDASEPNSKPSR